MYKAINELNRKKCSGSISIKDERGKLLNDPELVKNRWKEYIERLYNADDTEREMMDTLRSRQKRWLGHNPQT